MYLEQRKIKSNFEESFNQDQIEITAYLFQCYLSFIEMLWSNFQLSVESNQKIILVLVLLRFEID